MLVRLQPRAQARLCLLCFPYAGAAAGVYRHWAAAVPPHIEVCAIEYPGRGCRLSEAPVVRMSTLVETLANGLLPFLRQPVAFFGHSLGAAVAFELARLLQREVQSCPVYLIASGRRAPHLPSLRPPLHDLPEHDLVQELKALNGTPREVLESPEIMEIVLPFLRADFELEAAYVSSIGAPLDLPIAAYGGAADRLVGEDEIEAWRPYTRVAFRKRVFPGDHFFVNTARDSVLRAILEDLMPWSQDRRCAGDRGMGG